VANEPFSNVRDGVIEKDVYQILAIGCLRCMTYRCLHKYNIISSPETVEMALKFHTLPKQIQKDIEERNGDPDDNDDAKRETVPMTWFDTLEQLKARLSTGKGNETEYNITELWRLVLDHPMTAYVPVQCQSCGYVVPDDPHCDTPQDDARVGLKEIEPTGNELKLRRGWFRGPRGPVVFQLTCPSCQYVSHWYRSGHPRVILNPNKWGRQCGEQEELRLLLASYIGIPLRTIVPLDWDHIWSEYRGDDHNGTGWQVQDENARNFACRLDEGIGAWTGILAIHPNPKFCQDFTADYLICQEEEEEEEDDDDDEDDEHKGRADNQHASSMDRYRETVFQARLDASGEVTQAKTLNGYLLQRAGMTAKDITMVLRQAAKDYGSNKPWWELQSSSRTSMVTVQKNDKKLLSRQATPLICNSM